MNIYSIEECGFDIDKILRIVEKRRRKFISFIIVFAALAAILIAAAIISLPDLYIFFPIIALLAVLVLFGINLFGRLYVPLGKSAVSGEIKGVDYSVKYAHTMKTGTFGYWYAHNPRKYDSYIVKVGTGSLFIENDDGITSIYFPATEKHIDYYRTSNEALIIPGVSYPILKNPSGEIWVCPICGNLNTHSTCTSCKIVEFLKPELDL